MRYIFVTLLCTFFTIQSPLGFAAIFDWQNNRLDQLEKITVGPWDNFESSISVGENSSADMLYFTQDKNQVSSIFQQNIMSGEQRRVAAFNGDAKQPVLNSNGRLLAVTAFDSDAQGDICVLTINTDSVECISSNEAIDKFPFWIDGQKLGYLRRKLGEFESELVFYDFKSRQTTVIARGYISAPAANGRYIIYNLSQKSGAKRVLYDVKAKSFGSLANIDLPGSSGFYRFSKNNQWVYFSQYLNDSNRDQKIDANDNSVIFRLKFQDWLNASSPIFAEQLSSVDLNCNFPVPAHNKLYLTCAFGGSLDVYRLPLSGMVPDSWKQADIDLAHKSARQYEERLLLLNSLRYRYEIKSVEIFERIISNHLHINELTAASFYIQGLFNQKSLSMHSAKEFLDFYRVLDRLVALKRKKEQLPSSVLTARFIFDAEKVITSIRSLTISPQLLNLAEAYINVELQRSSVVIKQLDQLNFEQLAPMQKNIAFSLYRKVLNKTEQQRLLPLYISMANAENLPAEANIYYAFSYLAFIGESRFDLKQRLAQLDQFLLNSTQESVKNLIDVEKLTLSLIDAKDDKTKNIIYKKIAKQLKKNKKSLLLSKAMHVRAIQLCAEFEEFRYMEFFSRHWLTVTNIRQQEFYNAAQQYSIIVKDKAYGYMAEDQMPKAFSVFYSLIRQTNDLEGHFQYISIGLDSKNKKKARLEKAYKSLTKQKLLGNAAVYADAIKIIINNSDDVKVLDNVIAKLELLSRDIVGASMRDLLLGYIYHKKLRLTRNGYSFDKSAYKKAHYHYMMALDLGRENSRVTAAVWENLGWLHQEVGQYALSADFFTRRLTFEFTNLDQELRLRWSVAKSHFYNDQSSLALREIEQAIESINSVLKSEGNNKDELNRLIPYYEKAAFYAMQVLEFKKSIAYYQRIFSKKEKNGLQNKAKMVLAYAYALKKDHQFDLAKEQFLQVIQLCEKLSELPADNQRLISFQPKRLILLASGFLAELSVQTKEQISHRKTRIEILKGMQGKVKKFSYDEAARLAFLSKDYQLIALAYEKSGDLLFMKLSMDDAMIQAKHWTDTTGDILGPVVYRTLINYLSLAVQYPSQFPDKSNKDVEMLTMKMIDAFEKYPYPTGNIVAQQAKLQILRLKQQNKLKAMSAILQKESVQGIKQVLPKKYEQLASMVQFFIQ